MTGRWRHHPDAFPENQPSENTPGRTAPSREQPSDLTQRRSLYEGRASEACHCTALHAWPCRLTSGHEGECLPKNVYPSFYAAVHRSLLRLAHGGKAIYFRGDACTADPDRYEPDQHRCFDLAAAIRVELHAAGITLSNDGNAAADAHPMMIIHSVQQDSESYMRAWNSGFDEANRQRDQEQQEAFGSDSAALRAFRERLALYEQRPYEQADDVDERPKVRFGSWRDLVNDLIGRKVF